MERRFRIKLVFILKSERKCLYSWLIRKLNFCKVYNGTEQDRIPKTGDRIRKKIGTSGEIVNFKVHPNAFLLTTYKTMGERKDARRIPKQMERIVMNTLSVSKIFPSCLRSAPKYLRIPNVFFSK
ncbi:hypothetical protein LEP1GSC133_2772 [Leptospira borgpetersenii serovar Pomona str. 200901868]|uniref:Uncharacterized protein n=1 Tax=Leptospira borgpetersenii serovar Pomona str. 200901868 TaxID=1192866 RepID=M6WTD6_LEPBO|nr:hypothetical protein LEP1GSC133_2772 [Leptospira borgpetersenii serovar Pomona str. 200901868]